MKIRILIIHQDGLLTGSAKSLVYLLKGLDKSKFELHVIVGGPGPLAEVLGKEGYKVSFCKVHGFWTAPGPKWYRPGALKNVLALVRNKSIVPLVRKFRPDIIHLNDKALIGVGLRLRHLGIPIVQHLRSTYQATHIRLFKWISKRIIRTYASLLIAISEDEADEFDDFKSKVVIFNSMDVLGVRRDAGNAARIRQSLGISLDEKMILFIGLFTRTKGAWDFVDMVGYFKKNFGASGHKFVMAGPLPMKSGGLLRGMLGKLFPEEAAKFESKLRQNQIGNEVIFPGYLENILDVIESADVAVVCNRLGAMGRQAFEVLAVGTPLVITGGHSGKSTIVENGKNAVVVKAGDPEGMAIHLKKLLDNSSMQEQLTMNGKKHAQSCFDFKANGRLLEREYLKLWERTGIR